jgi:hypothetical protein
MALAPISNTFPRFVNSVRQCRSKQSPVPTVASSCASRATRRAPISSTMSMTGNAAANASILMIPRFALFAATVRTQSKRHSRSKRESSASATSASRAINSQKCSEVVNQQPLSAALVRIQMRLPAARPDRPEPRVGSPLSLRRMIASRQAQQSPALPRSVERKRRLLASLTLRKTRLRTLVAHQRLPNSQRPNKAASDNAAAEQQAATGTD